MNDFSKLREDDGLDIAVRVQRERDSLLAKVHGVIAEGLANTDVTEVIVNPDGSVWFDMLRGTLERQQGRDLSSRHVKNIITSIAGMLQRNIEHGILEGEFPFDGSRIEAWLPPLSIGPSIVIRKHRRQGLDGFPALSMNDYDIPLAWRKVFASIILERKNLLVVGSTASGKSTFVGAFLSFLIELCPDDRILTIEDTFELYCKAKNWLALHSTPHVSQRALLKTAMRARPDRIFIGECRDEVAIDMIMAMRTGHPGATTIHGDSEEDGLTRVLQLTRMDGRSTVDPAMVIDALPYVALMKRRNNPLPGESPRYLAGLKKSVAWRDERFVLEPIPSV